MKRNILFITLCFALSNVLAQQRNFPVDTVITTSFQATINGAKLNYKALTGMQPVWDDNGKPIATLNYTYYKQSGIDNLAKRPLLISFNGGPGSASVWMHIAYTGPKILNIDDEGYPIQPYGIKNNPNSILDVADILYVNPVNTGYSRTIPESGKDVKREQFFGINADITYLADWLNHFITRHNRWLSPKYIIGESYGGTRVAGLALELQQKQWMYLNGVILVSPADYKSYAADNALSHALNLPYFTAAAWYHNRLPQELQQKDLLEVLPQAEEFAIQQLLPAMAKGGFLEKDEKEQIATTMAKYSGLTKAQILDYNLQVPTSFFWKALLRDKKGYTIGRLDSRYLGLDKEQAGDSPDFNPELTSWLHAFTPAINYYFKNYLNFKTDLKYNMFGDVHPWDRRNDYTRENLRKAMAQNPYLKVLYQTGYYDGATTYFNSKYSMWQMDPSGRLKNRFTFKAYRSGHMMYLRKEDLKTANDDLRQFILNSSNQSVPAKY